MAYCGIKKYDELPAIVGWYDVDYCRWALGEKKKGGKRWTRRLVGDNFLGDILDFFTMPNTSEERLREMLDAALKRHEGEKRSEV